MKSLIILLLLAMAGMLPPQIVSETPIVYVDGLYYTDASQQRLYTGDYREFYETGAIRLEINIKDGKPTGTFIVYFPNGRPEEVRTHTSC